MKTMVVSILLFICTNVACADECKPLSGVTAVTLLPSTAGRPLIPVEIAGNKRAMILDTGAALTAVTPEAVNDLRLETSTVGATVNDVLGNQSSKAALLPSLEVGRLKAVNFKAMIMTGEITQREGSHIIGLFGADLLRNYDVDLDFAAHQVRLFSSDHCPGKVVFWRPKMLSTIPIRITPGGGIVIRMTLDGQEVNALLDTGSNTTEINADVAKKIFGLKPEGIGTVNGTELAVSKHRFTSLSIAGLTIANPEIAIAQNMYLDQRGAATQWYIRNHADAAPPDMLLGMRELSQLHIYIDYRDKTLFVSPAGDEILPPALASGTASGVQ